MQAIFPNNNYQAAQQSQTLWEVGKNIKKCSEKNYLVKCYQKSFVYGTLYQKEISIIGWWYEP